MLCVKCMQEFTKLTYISIYVYWPHCLPSPTYCMKRSPSVLLFSLEGAGESVSYSTSAEQDGERGGSGEGSTIPHMDKSGRSCVAYCPSPLQMMTAVEETGGCVPLSELVTGVTTRRCCRWVSPHTAHPHTVGGEVGYTTTLPRLVLLLHTAGGGTGNFLIRTAFAYVL